MKKSILRKIFNVISALAILSQSLTPYAVLLPQTASAQTVTPTDTSTPTPTPTIDQSQVTATPTPTVDPSTVTPTPTDVPTATPTPTPDQSTLTPTPTVDPSTITATPTPTDNLSPPSNNSSTSQVQGNSTSPTSTPTVSPTPAPEPTTGNEQVNLVILKNISAPAIDLSATVSQGSAVLTTDKPDYSPTDTALITGTGFNPGETYTLLITSVNNYSFSPLPSVTADSKGDIAYAYQLDGTYRPDYKVQVIDSTGKVVATTTFTDSPASGCTVDSAGANDEAGQKDLTKMCADYSGLPTSINIIWNWDDVSWSGSNTGDACSLYDTDGDGKANYALCVGVNGDPAVKAYTRLYSCSDGSATKCTGDTLISPSAGTSCATSLQNTDPFSAGSGFPADTVATCTVAMADVGGVSSTLLDVCSYPSGVPHSDSSDCILFKSNAGKLTVTKVLSPSNDPGLFNLQVDGTTQAANVGDGGTTLTQEVSEGNHTVGEIAGTATNLSNYTSSVVCKDGHGTGNTVTTTGTNPWTLNVGEGKDVLCTITNTRINNGSITIIKDAVPNDAQDFAFTASGSGLTNFSLDDDSDPTLSNTKVFSNLAAGTYSVSEGTVTGWTQTSATCTDGSPVSAISLQAGENVTCTFTNTKQPTLTVHKDVINHGGNKTTANFAPYKVDTTTVSLDQVNVFSIGSHTVTETPDANYTATFSGDCDANGNVSLAAGDSKTCTITNEEKAAKVVVHKIVVNHGLTNDTTHFAPYKVGTTTVVLDAETVMNSGSYVVSEAADSNYTASFTAGDCDANGNITLVAGQTKTCTITNEENATHLKLTKVVINHGGRKVVSDFPLFIDGNSVTSGANNLVNSGAHSVSETGDSNYTATISGNCDTNGNVTLTSGANGECTITNEEKLSDITVHKVVVNHGGNKVAADFGPYKVDSTTVTLDQATTFDSGNHTVTETPNSSYTATFSNGCDSNGVVALGSGEHKTCTITNEEKPAKLIVTKVVINDNGGTKVVSDFPLFVGQTGVTSGDTNTFDSGAYVVSETNPTGYTGVISGDCNANGNVTLVAGQTKSCTITNDDNVPSLTLDKIVTNNNGGSNVEGDWTLTATGPTTISGPGSIGHSDLVSGASFSAGTYSLSESGPTGYSASSWSCVKNNDAPITGSSVTLGLGDTATCTITNSDIAPTLKLVKHVTKDNGGTAVAGDWTLTATGITGGFSDSGDSTTFHIIKAGVSYTLSESNVPGYSAGNWSCDGGSLTGDSLTLGLNENVTCDITNNDIAPSLTLVKVVSNTHGGNAVTSNWTLTATGPTPISGAGGATSDSSFGAGTYTLSESTGPSGYDAGDWSCVKNNGAPVTDSSITLANGDNATCTITNYDKTAQIILIKNVIKDNGGTAGPNNFGISINGLPVTSGTTYNVDSNTPYTLNETGLSGYSFVSLTGNTKCPSVLGGTITLDEGESVTCTITNDDQTGHLIVHKVTDPANDTTPFTITATGDGTISGDATRTDLATNNDVDYTVDAGTYNVSEETNSEWAENDSNCQGVSVANGQTKECTIYNTKLPKLAVYKVCNPREDLGKFNLFIDQTQETSDTICGGWTNGQVIVSVGEHTVSETAGSGTNLDNYTSSIVCDGQPTDTVTLAAGENKSCTITNTRNTGTLLVHKMVDRNGNGTFTSGDDSEFTWGFNSNPTDNTYLFGDSKTLNTGPYSVYENSVTNYHPVGWYPTDGLNADENPYTCDSPKSTTLPASVDVTTGNTTEITICNARDTGTLIVHKMVDTGKGTFDVVDTDANTLGFRWGFDTTASNNTNTFGGTGTTLPTDSYSVYENNVSGYKFVGWISGDQTDNQFACTDLGGENQSLPVKVNLTNGQTNEITLCNKTELPILTIAKVNDAVGNKAPGDVVTYTLTVTAGETGGPADNVTVTDLLPKGFVYNNGSWTANSNPHGVLSLSEPTYHSPGVWTVGHMDSGEIITLQYKATIDGGQQTGTYYDNAWAQGTAVGSSDVLFASAVGQPGQLDDTFVGTEVAIVNGSQAGVSYKGTSTQSVLGAETFLPATGESTLWVIIATLLMGLGLGTVFAGFKLKKRYE